MYAYSVCLYVGYIITTNVHRYRYYISIYNDCWKYRLNVVRVRTYIYVYIYMCAYVHICIAMQSLNIRSPTMVSDIHACTCVSYCMYCYLICTDRYTHPFYKTIISTNKYIYICWFMYMYVYIPLLL